MMRTVAEVVEGGMRVDDGPVLSFLSWWRSSPVIFMAFLWKRFQGGRAIPHAVRGYASLSCFFD